MKVITLDRFRFAGACVDLWHRAVVDFQPDAVIGIRTGGLLVAEAMPVGRVPVIPITRQRPSTAAKSGNAWIGRILRRLPYVITDRLRQAEHLWLTRGGRAGAAKPAEPRPWAPDELAVLTAFIHDHPGCRLLVVDDAVDSGATLRAVADLVASIDAAAQVRSAVVVTTTSNPVVAPDVSLYRGALCRFPWSHDFAG